MDIITNHKTEIVTGLFLLSEILALVPNIKSNSVFQLIANFIKKLANK